MPGDLLRTLNAAIDSSEVYTGYKKARIEELRLRKTGARSTEDIYQINCEIIDNYESFLCDSAEYYVLQNIRIARSLGNPDHLSESRLRLAFLYSLSGRSKYSKAYSVRAIPRPIPMPWVRCAWPKPTGRRATARWRNAT